jgi:hypothetical protein
MVRGSVAAQEQFHLSLNHPTRYDAPMTGTGIFCLPLLPSYQRAQFG